MNADEKPNIWEKGTLIIKGSWSSVQTSTSVLRWLRGEGWGFGFGV